MKGKRFEVKEKKIRKRDKPKRINNEKGNTNKKGKKKFKHLIIILILLLLLIIFIYLFIERNNIFNRKVTTMTEVEQTIKVQTVENADYLEIADLDVVSKDGYSTVKTSIKNTSNETVINIRLDICIYDKDNNLISQLTNPIASIAPNETIDSFGIVSTELLDDYICIIKKN